MIVTTSTSLRKGDIVHEPVASMGYDSRDVIIREVVPGVIWYHSPATGEWETQPVLYVRGTDVKSQVRVVWTKVPYEQWGHVTKASDIPQV